MIDWNISNMVAKFYFHFDINLKIFCLEARGMHDVNANIMPAPLRMISGVIFLHFINPYDKLFAAFIAPKSTVPLNSFVPVFR